MAIAGLLARRVASSWGGSNVIPIIQSTLLRYKPQHLWYFVRSQCVGSYHPLFSTCLQAGCMPTSMAQRGAAFICI